MDFIKNLALLVSATVMLTGCTATLSYRAKAVAGPPKPVGYPIFVYTEEMKVPRPCQVIGTIEAGYGNFMTFGESPEKVMKAVMKKAEQKGADAVRVTSMIMPDFMNPNYRVNADLLRYADSWESIAISEEEFRAYLKQNARTLDPIEGVWSEQGPNECRIGIMKDSSKPGRDFVAFILGTKFAPWQNGYKKIDIARGSRRGAYLFDYCLDDFARQETTVILGEAGVFQLDLQTLAGGELVIYLKN